MTLSLTLSSATTRILYREVLAGTLAPALTDYCGSDPDAYAVYPATRHLAHRTRIFIDFLAARFGDLPYWDDCLDDPSVI